MIFHCKDQPVYKLTAVTGVLHYAYIETGVYYDSRREERKYRTYAVTAQNANSHEHLFTFDSEFAFGIMHMHAFSFKGAKTLSKILSGNHTVQLD